jgi:hypothetical protein
MVKKSRTNTKYIKLGDLSTNYEPTREDLKKVEKAKSGYDSDDSMKEYGAKLSKQLYSDLSKGKITKKPIKKE